MNARLPLPLPASRTTVLTAEVEERAGGSIEWFVYYDGDYCLRQGTARNAEEAAQHVRDLYGIEPKRMLSATRKKELANAVG